MNWNEINNKRLPFIRMGEQLFAGMFQEVRSDFLKEVVKAGSPEQVYGIAEQYKIDQEKIMLAYERFYSQTGKAFAKETAKSIKGKIETKQEDDWLKEILEYVRAKVGYRISSVTQTHYEDIIKVARQAVETGITEGWGMEKIASEIFKTQSQMDMWKAMRIARTEVVSASNMGVKIGGDELIGNKKKVWISTFDSRSREDHMAMDGVTVAYNENFMVAGEELEYPGDPSGSAGNTINCRCGWEIIVESEIY